MKHRTRRPKNVRASQGDLIGYDHQAIAPAKSPEFSERAYSAIIFLRKQGFTITRRGPKRSHIKGPGGIDRQVDNVALGAIASRLGWKP